jgi:hypothetical protein
MKCHNIQIVDAQSLLEPRQGDDHTLSATNTATPPGRGSSRWPKPNILSAALVLTGNRPRGASPDFAQQGKMQAEGDERDSNAPQWATSAAGHPCEPDGLQLVEWWHNANRDLSLPHPSIVPTPRRFRSKAAAAALISARSMRVASRRDLFPAAAYPTGDPSRCVTPGAV